MSFRINGGDVTLRLAYLLMVKNGTLVPYTTLLMYFINIDMKSIHTEGFASGFVFVMKIPLVLIDSQNIVYHSTMC